MSRISLPADHPASRTAAINSPSIESLRRRLQGSIPYGTEKQVALRLGRPAEWVYAQVEGRHPLTGDVILGCLHVMPEGSRDVALEELLDGMVRIERRVQIADQLRAIADMAAQTLALLEVEK